MARKKTKRKTRRLRSMRGNPGLSREALLAIRNDIEAGMRVASAILRSYPRGPSGLVSDEVRASAQYRADKAAYASLADSLRRVNKVLVKMGR